MSDTPERTPNRDMCRPHLWAGDGECPACVAESKCDHSVGDFCNLFAKDKCPICKVAALEQELREYEDKVPMLCALAESKQPTAHDWIVARQAAETLRALTGMMDAPERTPLSERIRAIGRINEPKQWDNFGELADEVAALEQRVTTLNTMIVTAAEREIALEQKLTALEQAPPVSAISQLVGMLDGLRIAIRNGFKVEISEAETRAADALRMWLRARQGVTGSDIGPR